MSDPSGVASSSSIRPSRWSAVTDQPTQDGLQVGQAASASGSATSAGASFAVNDDLCLHQAQRSSALRRVFLLGETQAVTFNI